VVTCAVKKDVEKYGQGQRKRSIKTFWVIILISAYEKNVKTVMVKHSAYINKTNNNYSPQIIAHKKDHDVWHWKSIC
jgi:hypothetical protein